MIIDKKHVLYHLLSTVIFLGLVGLPSLSANEKRYNLKFVPIQSNLLPSNEVRKLYQDSDGYIWFPTYNGLARYDGYNVITYGFQNKDNETFNPYINVVVEDNEKNLWIGTEKGLYKLHIPTGTILSLNHEILKNCNISALLFGVDGTLWIGGGCGLFKKDVDKGFFESIEMGEEWGNLIISVTSMVEDTEKNLWISGWEQGLFKYNEVENKFDSYIDPILKYSHVIFKDYSDNIWIGTWGEGLLEVEKSPDTDKINYRQYKHNEKDSNSILDNIIYSIGQDDIYGKIWVGSRSGLSILHKESELYSFFENYTPGNEYGQLPFNEVNSILRTKDNLMWLGMLGGGVCKIQIDNRKIRTNNLQVVKNKYKTSSVKSIYHDGNNEFWMGIAGFGMIKFNETTNTFTHYSEDPTLKNLPYTSVVSSIIKRRTTGEMCFGTWNNGVWFYNEQTNKVHTLNKDIENKFHDDCISALMEDSEGNLWIGSRGGIYILDSNNRFFTLSEWLNQDVEFLSSRIFDLKEDGLKNIWLATNYHGIIKINLKTKEWSRYSNKNGVNSDNIFCLLVDHRQRVWAGTTHGLSYYDHETNSFLSVSTIPNKAITNIIEDDLGGILVTTNDAILSIFAEDSLFSENIIINSVSNVSQQFTFNKNVCFKMPNGEIIFGGSHGLKALTVNEREQFSASFPVVFTDLKIHGVSIRDFPSDKRRRITDRDINYTKEITLKYTEKIFYIEFSLPNYADFNENIYSYMLEGYDSKPILVNAQQHFAIYTNLPSGSYTFRVKGANGKGTWTEEKSLLIHILPAPWLSKKAYILYITLFFLISFITIKSIKDRLRMKYEVNLNKLEKQKAEELNHAKLQFFTNVTHELMTPLSIIIASIENINKNEDKQYLYAVISTNALRLMRLIQQILEFRKIESGNLKLCVSKGDISSFIKKCIEAFSPLVKKKCLTVYYNSIPEKIIGFFDSDKLDKIIYNLLSNAAKYTSDGGEIRIELYLEENDILRILVINKGGELIKKEKIASLFERFYEGDYRKYHTIGTGIGLSLVKDLVCMHHGSIEVSSEEFKGNCFQVILPVSKESYNEEQIEDSIINEEDLPYSTCPVIDTDEADNKDDLIRQKTDYTILVVDDNEELRMLISNLLSYYFRVETAVNGKHAIEALRKASFDLIISDIMMPEMDGIELCRYLKNQIEYCHIPVILLTAKSSDTDKIEGYDSGADGYVCKPFNFPLLYAQIVNLLKKQERISHNFRKQLVFEVDELEYTSMDAVFIQKAIDCVNDHIDDCEFSQGKFSEEMATSKTTLTEKLKKLTGFTPSAFIANVRLTVACRLMEEQPDIQVADLAFAVGFNDPKYFSTCFRKKYSCSPRKYKEQLRQKG